MTIDHKHSARYATVNGQKIIFYAKYEGAIQNEIHGAIIDGTIRTPTVWDLEGIQTLIGKAGNNLKESLQPNGIPEDYGKPPEFKGYTWTIIGWGDPEKAFRKGSRWSSYSLGKWMSEIQALQPHANNHRQTKHEFYIEYVPIIKEMTTTDAEAYLSKALNKEVKITQ